MSRNYDNWERLVRAVRRREKDRQIAHSESFSSFSSSDISSRPTFASDASSAIRFEETISAIQDFQPDMSFGEGRSGPVFPSVYNEKEKRLKDFEFAHPEKDLRELKQILEAMQIEGFFRTSKNGQAVVNREDHDEKGPSYTHS